LIVITSPLWIWPGENGSWHFITVPEDQADEIRAHCLMEMRGFRSARVEARIGEVSWRTSVFPLKSGGYILPVKKDVRRRAGIAAGDEVTVELELL
jgi:hypothetical protein